ncbi:MAG: helicase [Pseudomonadales bacterium]|nr:helicase [Pseudomonadales bacterium]
MSMNYEDFLSKKAQEGASHGFEPVFMPEQAFDFQESLINWAVSKGRGALFADCGLGKTLMELAWAENVFRKTGGNVLIVTCLAVAAQMVEEAEKFNFSVKRSSDGSVGKGITITNYERLHLFNPQDFAGVVCDESSILKNFKGSRKQDITDFLRKRPYRLLATATAAPNDFIELGTSSEALGYLGYMDMLNKFFKNDLNNSASGRMRGEVIKWRLKGHAELPFWRWVTTWARACRKPSDLGFSDGKFALPGLTERQHVVSARTSPDGMLFSLPAHGLSEQREERRRTLNERCERAAELANNTSEPVILWCHLNDEGKELRRLIPDAVEVAGSDSDEAKEERLIGFAKGKYRVLITKPKIGAWGLNYQHCNRVVYFPSHSFEQYYQSLRRCWRFGQKRVVEVDVVSSEGEADILSNLQRKAAQCEEMFSNLVSEMNNATGVFKSVGDKQVIAPNWL